MKIHTIDCEQRSSAWFAARCGRLTGSAVGELLKVRKRGTGELEGRATLRRRLVAERLTKLCLDDLPFVPYDVQRGLDLEPLAFAAYEGLTGLLAERVGFVQHTELMIGCSPDGRIGEWEGGVEIKAPKATTHLEWIQDGVLPDEHRAQCLMGLLLTGAQWWDFCSFHPDFPQGLDLFRVRLDRNETELAALDLLIQQFLDEVDRDLNAVLLKAQGVAA